MDVQPNSILTLTMPDIWQRGLILATDLTGYRYEPKVPLPDGTVYACGGYWNPTPRSKKEILDDDLAVIDRQIDYWKRVDPNGEQGKTKIAELEKERQERIDKDGTGPSASSVFVPEGAMEWLLHEVGHWVAATPEERLLPDYGYGTIKKKGWGKDREWQAWAFEEIILAPFGPARDFAAPSYQGGTGFSKAGPIPAEALRHIEHRMKTQGMDPEQWREVWADWVHWGVKLGPDAPWRNAQ